MIQTPSQTIGPFFAYGLTPEESGYKFSAIVDHSISGSGQGDEIDIHGSVFDGAGQVVTDALIEIWQADENGRISDGYAGFARSGTENGEFHFATIKPGKIDKSTAPHISVIVFMRGLLNHVFTRMYFAGDQGNADDPTLMSIAASRRATLVAEHEEPGVYRFDIHMQGDREIVFFDI